MYRSRSLVSRHLLRHDWRSITITTTSSSRLFHLGRIGSFSDALGQTTTTNITVRPSDHHRTLLRRTLILNTAAEPLRIERLSDSDSGIIELKLDRPEVKNAISRDLIRGLQRALEVIDGDSSAKVVMVCSAIPKIFCAGADLKERRLLTSAEALQYAYSLRSTLTSLEALSIPTIAAVEGPALGGGLELALSCDLRICGEDAMFGMPETGLAIIPGAGGTQRLPRIVGSSIAKELIFTGRRITGKEAMSMGLVNHCVPAGEAYFKALEVARVINEKSPLAIKMAKQAINQGLEVEMPSALAVEGDCYNQLLNTEDRLEGLAAFAEKRKPRYTGK